jgi:DNA-binding beta-propeller fold protein YncE
MHARKTLLVALVLPMVVGLALSSSSGQAGYSLLTTIKIPNVPHTPPWAFDISWIDPVTRTYYLADRTNAAVDTVDVERDTFTGFIAKGHFRGFTGDNDTSGPNGILTLGAQLWAGDGDSSVKLIDLASGQVVRTISTSFTDSQGVFHGVKRADELCFDARNDLIAIANDADDPPFVTFISTETQEVVGHILFPGAGGLEQCAWDPDTSRVLQNVPSTAAHPGGEVVAIDPKRMTIVKVYPVEGCEPAGMALGPHHNLLLGCSSDAIADGFPAKSLVMDAQTGHIIATITQVGGSDQVWFNPGDNRYYLAARGMTSNGLKSGTPTPVLGVIDAETNTWVTNVPTGTNSHSVAADPVTNRIFVPLRSKGVGVFVR